MSGEIIYKMTGSGNDFVFLDGRWTELDAWPADRIRRVCARGTGVGADGLIVLGPGSGPGAVRFHFFNSDGSRGAMCGNGALCATRLAALLELAPADDVRLETDAGLVRSRCVPDTSDRAELALPNVTDVRFPEIDPNPGEHEIGYAVVGVPHLVVRVDDLETVDVLGRGRALRAHPSLGEAGANVNFVAASGDSWAMRTYERGVEDETLACGTGAVASSLILSSTGRTSLPWSVHTRSGTVLTVSGKLDPETRHLHTPSLGGEGKLVFRGVLEAGF
ncbi:MAG: diaminopimelate epimerase [Gemmatimonadota bacterium]|nr:diaminopimelate epimerase [Gemmatimonadota bacterium]